MVKLLGGRGAAAIIGLFMLAIGSSEAGAQSMPNVQSLVTPAVLTTTTTTTAPARPAQTVKVVLPPSIDREASWLYRAGWPLYALVNKYSVGAPLSQEANCVATAVYFEARGESVEGQLAVAKVIMNRAASGKYPASWCSVVTQPWQFSFVNPHTGELPAVDTTSAAWATAQGVTRIALTNVVPSLSNDVLWYHANYVAPSWGHRLSMATRIGAHIFYRS
ncbi:MAG: cell wall hydrolase [Sphingomicrobium sp.]